MKLLKNVFIRYVIGALISTLIGVVLLIPVVKDFLIPAGYNSVYIMFVISGGYMFGVVLPVSLLAHFDTSPLSRRIVGLITGFLVVALTLIWIKTGVQFSTLKTLIYITLFSIVYRLIDEWLQSKARKLDTNSTYCTNNGEQL